MHNIRHNFMRTNHGASLVEFALSATVFLLLMFGIIDVGNFYWNRSTLNYAVTQAARYAYINPGYTTGQINTYALSQMPSNMTPTFSITIVPNSTVTVTGTMPYTFIGLPLAPSTLTSTVVQPLAP